MEDWRDRAACRDEDPELFFPIGDGVAAQDQVGRAKAVCARCPVRQQCLQFALSTGQDAGIWGGLTAEERRDLRRSGRAGADEGANRAAGSLVGRGGGEPPAATVVEKRRSA